MSVPYNSAAIFPMKSHAKDTLARTDNVIDNMQKCSEKLKVLHDLLKARQTELSKQAELLVKWTEALKVKADLLNEKEKLLNARE